MAAKFEIYVDAGGQFRFRLKAANGQNILSSEAYKQRASAVNGVQSVQNNARDDNRYDRKQTSSGKFIFNLKAANGQIIGSSETYESAASRDKGIESVKKNAPDAQIVDL